MWLVQLATTRMAEGMEVEAAPAIRDKKRFEVKKVSRFQRANKSVYGVTVYSN